MEILSTPLENTDVLEERHGVEFVLPDSGQFDDFVWTCRMMSVANENVVRISGDLSKDSSRLVVVQSPEIFLRDTLTSEQKKSVNELETDEVAELSVKMQDGLLLVPIEESFERMTSLEEVFELHGITASFSDLPFHEACGDWAGKERQFWTREEFAQRLALMGAFLSNVGLQIHFEDAFRPLGVQEGLFRRRVAWTQADHPDWTIERVLNEARSKTAVTPRLASHKAGAAVDLMLRRTDGTFLDIGHKYPEGGALVYQRTPFVTQEQWHNRQLLVVASSLAGLSMYVGEDWHLSHGDNLASLDSNLDPRPGYVAKYGPIKSFDKKSGEITEVYRAGELDGIFEL